jgi:DNA-binding NtrC family response regulator
MAQVKLVIVDDEVKLANTYKSFFEATGCAVWAVTKGEDVIPLIEQHRPNVFLVDWGLAGSKLQGVPLLQRIKALVPEAKLLLYSGYDADQMKEAVKGVAVDHFLEKPLMLQALLKLIQDTPAPSSS